MFNFFLFIVQVCVNNIKFIKIRKTMKLIQFIFCSIFIGFNEIIKFSIKKPMIALLLILSFWVNSLPLPDENIVRNNSVTLIVDGEKRKFDLAFHIRLERYFPDWNTRITYQQEREELYKSAMRKRREALKIRSKENLILTEQEQDAIDYFAGKDFYKEQQDLRKNPNIFDSRQSFLFKMHNKKMRDNFLKSYNQDQNNQ